ncbi:MAG TPA: hypothetical protein VFX17_04240 [Patescibacteria group bacterium]|nr:hypothetical protein [Patescibacteria group bacterium]
MIQNPLEFAVQGLVIIIVIGGFYSLHASTKAYGGLIGRAIRLLGAGMLFVVIAVIEKFLINFGLLEPTTTLSLVQDCLNLLGVLFLGLGFSRLAAAAKV